MSINNFLFVKFNSLLLLFGFGFFRIIFIPIFYIFLLRISVLHFGKMIRLYIDRLYRHLDLEKNRVKVSSRLSIVEHCNILHFSIREFLFPLK